MEPCGEIIHEECEGHTECLHITLNVPRIHEIGTFIQEQIKTPDVSPVKSRDSPVAWAPPANFHPRDLTKILPRLSARDTIKPTFGIYYFGSSQILIVKSELVGSVLGMDPGFFINPETRTLVSGLRSIYWVLNQYAEGGPNNFVRALFYLSEGERTLTPKTYLDVNNVGFLGFDAEEIDRIGCLIAEKIEGEAVLMAKKDRIAFIESTRKSLTGETA